MNRAQLLDEMGLSPQWKLRSGRSVKRGEMPAIVEPKVLSVAPAAAVSGGYDSHGSHDSHALPGAAFAPATAVARERLSVVPRSTQDAEKIAQLDWPSLQTSVSDCRACGLCAERQQALSGVGDQQADWFFIGDAPSAEDDAQAAPFVGAAGKLLDAMLGAIDLKREVGVYLTHAVKCHPPEQHGNAAISAELRAEMATCAPYLKRQIALAQPKIIVLFGQVAVQALLGLDQDLASLRGKPLVYHLGEREIPVVVTYHPAYLLRNLPDKSKAWEDLCRARALMCAAEF